MSIQRTRPQIEGSGIQSIQTSDTPNVYILSNSTNDSHTWASKVKRMRRHPTIKFLRRLINAPIQIADWSVVNVNGSKGLQPIKDELYQQLMPLRQKFCRDAVRGILDYGWQPFEVKTAYNNRTRKICVQELKPLLQQLTQILIDPEGSVCGLRNSVGPVATSLLPGPASWVDLYWGQAIVVTYDVEGDLHYGDALMRALESPFDGWELTEEGARRFDKKVAGAHWIVYYPPGTTLYNGVMTDNSVIAAAVAKTLQSSGIVTIPNAIHQQIADLNGLDPTKLGWRVELISANTQQSSFIDRAKYLDALMARALGFPERAIFEGQFGTKAESEAHSDFAVDALELMSQDIVTAFNKGVVDLYLETNYGPEYKGLLAFQPSALNSNKKAFLRSMYQQHAADPNGGAALEDEAIDWDTIRDGLGIPTRPKTARDLILPNLKGTNDDSADPPDPDPSADAAKPER